MSNVRNFGAAGDGQADDTEALQHAVDQGDGVVELPRGDYRITAPIVLDTTQTGRAAVMGSGGTAKVLMAGPGPAFVFIGDHAGTADPLSFRPEVWRQQRLPTMLNVEIEGAHAEADGVRLDGTVQATLEGVLIHHCRHGMHLAKRNRNVLITGCHVYYNTGVGVYLDAVNLHQINITGNHISYNRLGGVVINRSEVRNLQITGNDIEYNNHRAHQTDPLPVADVFFDCSDPNASVREGTIAGNTIQATESPGGANVRMVGRQDDTYGTAGMWTITGNLIGSQETNIDLMDCRAVTVTGNIIYTAHRRNVRVRRCRSIVLSGNCLDHNHSRGNELPLHLRFEDCEGVNLNGNIVHDHPAPKFVDDEHAQDGTVVFARCRRVTVSGNQITDANRDALHFDACGEVNIGGCTISSTRQERTMVAAVRFKGEGGGNLVAGNTMVKGVMGAIVADEASGVTMGENVVTG